MLFLSLYILTTAIEIPGIARCLELMDEFAMLPNIRRHSVVVAQVALQLIEGFEANDVRPRSIPDKGLTLAGALLHDIAKTPCLKNGCDHARKGAEICLELGFGEIAAIVEEHVVLKDHDPVRRGRGCFNAREIVYYADKRVRHEEIVSLDDRLEYILEHYGNGDAGMRRQIRDNFDKCVELERNLFAYLPFSSGELAGRVGNDAAVSPFLFLSGREGI